MLQTFTLILDWCGLCVFAISGALVASRKEMDIAGFALLGSVTGIGGSTTYIIKVYHRRLVKAY
jgi:uncharacterized membrane protein YeiH